MHIRSPIVAREFKRWRQARLVCGTSPAGSSESFRHCSEFSLLHVDVSRAFFHAKAQRLVLVKLPVEGCSGKDTRKIRLLKKSMYGTRQAPSNLEREWQGHLENWSYELERVSRNLFHNKKRKTSGLTHGDDFVVTGTKGVCWSSQSKQASSGQFRQRVSKR